MSKHARGWGPRTQTLAHTHKHTHTHTHTHTHVRARTHASTHTHGLNHAPSNTSPLIGRLNRVEPLIGERLAAVAVADLLCIEVNIFQHLLHSDDEHDKKKERTQDTAGHRAQGTGHRAQGTGHGVRRRDATDSAARRINQPGVVPEECVLGVRACVRACVLWTIDFMHEKGA